MGPFGKPKIIAVVGPTASGKSALGLELARRLNGEILCVDSRTVYRGMDIGTAKPVGERPEASAASIKTMFAEKPLVVEGVPHWGLNLVEPDEEYSVAEFKAYAEKKIAEILKRKHLPILVGGTGLWMDAVVQNLDIPEVKANPALRAELDVRTVEDLFAEYEALDPNGALEIDRHNKRRLVRAIEVCRETGRPFSELRQKGEENYDCLWLGLEVPRDELNRRIDERVDVMIAHKLVDEVRALKERFGCEIPSMSGIGYRQVCWFLDGYQSLKDAIEDVKTDTKQFAKRQMTWFKRNKNIRWVADVDAAVALALEFYQ